MSEKRIPGDRMTLARALAMLTESREAVAAQAQHIAELSDARDAVVAERDRLAEEIKRAESYSDRWHTEMVEWRKRVDVAEKTMADERADRRRTVDDLKSTVRTLELENARLGGYIERVDSDDQARDGRMEVQVPPRTFTLRPPAPISMTSCERGGAVMSGVDLEPRDPRRRR